MMNDGSPRRTVVVQPDALSVPCLKQWEATDRDETRLGSPLQQPTGRYRHDTKIVGTRNVPIARRTFSWFFLTRGRLDARPLRPLQRR